MSLENLPLDVLQGWMQDALIFPRRTSAGEVAQVVLDSPTLTATQCVAIYQRSYSLRLLRCLEDQFPALSHALGHELFVEFAREYLQQKPSESYTLYDLGRRFPGYLEETRPDRKEPPQARETWIDFMVDLARFERDVFVMFDAPGHEGKPFATTSTPDDRLNLQPCFKLHESRFPVAQYYHGVRNETQPALPPRTPSLVALARQDYVVRTFPLSPLQHQFLAAMQQGLNAVQALEKVAEDSGRPQAELVHAWAGPHGVRGRWIEMGFFVEVEQ